MEDPLECIREALRRERCVPFVGAGASIEGGAPTWNEYLAQLQDGLPYKLEFEGMDPTDAASFIQSERSRLELKPVPVSVGGPTSIHHILASWECPLYVTTNYDDGMELALRNAFQNPVIVPNDQLDCAGLLGDGTRGQPILVKLASSSKEMNPGAKTREDFAYLIHRDRLALELLVTILRCYTVLFVGCSMRDPLITQALNHVYAQRIGTRRHLAIVPDSYSEGQRHVLRKFAVESCTFHSKVGTKDLADVLSRCKKAPTGLHHLIVFEPGTPTKMRQIADVLNRCSTLELARVAILTENPIVAQIARNIGSSHANLQDSIKIDVFLLTDIGDIESVKKELMPGLYFWDSIMAPYEYAVANAAKLAEAWAGRHQLKAHFHSEKVATISRDKRQFRQVIEGWQDDLLSHVPFKILRIEGEPNVENLRRDVSKAAQELGAQRVVIKPPDAAGSIGVRPLDLCQEEGVASTLQDLVLILEAMPVSEETARCEVSELIVEQRIEGEEFSVESRCVDGVIETLAVHWKVDIDGDKTRFFERLFVTLPLEVPPHAILDEANKRLLRGMGVKNGVFHAEFRVDLDCNAIYPIEVGLRPGGGMVSNSVRESRGVDLFEAALRCAVRVQKNEPSLTRTVATGLVFAKRPGVLPPLGIRDKMGLRFVNHEDPSSLREWLRRRLATVPREEARAALEQVVGRPHKLCADVLSAFDESPNKHSGLCVQLKQVEPWIRPGSMVTEEEACYVAGLLIVADERLSPLAAVAESVAAMELCLNAIVCEPNEGLSAVRWRSARISEDKLDWFTDLSSGGFQSDIDSFTFARAIELARGDGKPAILDLGCGAARPAFRAVKSGCEYLGVDISEHVVWEARGNLAKARQNGWRVEVDDVTDDNFVDKLSESVQLLVANLPYLPTPYGVFSGDLAREVDGGLDGLRFVPHVLTLAQKIKPEALVLTMSSLCNLDKLGLEVEKARLGVCRVVATVAHLGSYANRVRAYLEEDGFSKLYGHSDDLRQIIYAFEFRHDAGIPLHTLVEQTVSVLNPNLNKVGTMAIGAVVW